MTNFKRILRYLGFYKSNIILVFLFIILSVVFSLFSFAFFIPVFEILFKTKTVELIAPTPISWNNIFNSQILKDNFYYYSNSFIDNVGPQQALFYIILFITLSFFLKNLFRYLESFFTAPIRNGVMLRMRNELYNKILILPLSFYSERKKGDLITRLTSDVQEVELSVVGSLVMLIREPITLILYVATLIILSPKMTLFSFILLPFSGFIIGKISRSLKRTAHSGQAHLSNLISTIEESIDGLRIIKAFNAIDHAQTNFEKENQRYTKFMNKIYRIRHLATPLSEFLGVCVVALAIWFGGRLILNGGSLSAPELIVYIVIFSQILPPIKNVTQSYYDIKKGAASLDRIDSILKAEEVIVEKDNAISKSSFDEKIQFIDVSFKYEEALILKHISFTIEKGKKVAIVGPSGAGKSSIINLMSRFYDCTSGVICVDNIPIPDLKINDLRDFFGLVNQDTILFNDTVAGNIAFGFDNYNINDIIKAAKVANAHDFIMELPQGYDTIIGDRGTKLSGGQRQRLSIARALLKNPPILLLDEATSSLDTESEKAVQEALELLMQSRTSIIVAHRLSTITNCDKIIVLDKGEIVEEGTHEELYSQNGLYKKLCDMQTI
ncbi:ABC transporter ATP-binding protein/permease [Bacteroidales bacterium OttesenSCG-928-K03]|nr:ABC transporter ATP-binding protein/permease [Odoribacter sp. OttesenSCG-928-L07]MDL2239402.1 ABC transporter ATP-binding protein/permease [Bacteroidales bacterium OttesenSCG-928-L14]MDL2240738.1 ABC transporter ATP-binding protein/permease [Bacteroidales bacterium OttesenSCG-928-K22]MDL2242733.1 ABC transporter ATP-binding protein/permease [Bacteroidales bacterium OttesenSCG-928-K03]